MRKLLIFGNSGSGKTTLARKLCAAEGLAHLDLDTIAWGPASPPERTPLAHASQQIDAFVQAHDGWVIEGCYADLLALAAPAATEMIYLDLPVETCMVNAQQRPWEPHKYASKAAQDDNLEMLLAWIADYEVRTDSFSQAAHQQLYDAFKGKKKVLTTHT